MGAHPLLQPTLQLGATNLFVQEGEMYHNDDGSTFGGIVFVACLIIAFCAGYTLRDQGITLKVQTPQVQRGAK